MSFISLGFFGAKFEFSFNIWREILILGLRVEGVFFVFFKIGLADSRPVGACVPTTNPWSERRAARRGKQTTEMREKPSLNNGNA